MENLDQETMLFALDWDLEQGAFNDSVRELINRAEKDGKVLAMPLHIVHGKAFFDVLVALLANVNCDGCSAVCCRQNPGGKPFPLPLPDYERLAKKYGQQFFRRQGKEYFIDMPCPFLKNTDRRPVKDFCKIYHDRPFDCVLYPFQLGAADEKGAPMIAMASSCPEARRIARRAYMTAWRLRRSLKQLDGDFYNQLVAEK